MKTMTIGVLKEIIEDLPDDFEIYMNYDVFVHDPIDKYEVSYSEKRLTLS